MFAFISFKGFKILSIEPSLRLLKNRKPHDALIDRQGQKRRWHCYWEKGLLSKMNWIVLVHPLQLLVVNYFWELWAYSQTYYSMANNKLSGKMSDY